MYSLSTDETTGAVTYYSIPCQLHAMLLRLDADDLERRLCSRLYELMPQIVRQMRITQQLTESALSNDRVERRQKGLKAPTPYAYSYLMRIQCLCLILLKCFLLLLLQ